MPVECEAPVTTRTHCADADGYIRRGNSAGPHLLSPEGIAVRVAVELLEEGGWLFSNALTSYFSEFHAHTKQCNLANPGLSAFTESDIFMDRRTLYARCH